MATTNPREVAYRQMLIKLGSLITTQELSSMKFYVKSFKIGTRRIENIESCVDLWSRLEEQKLLSRTNLAMLTDMLKACTVNRLDVLDVVKQFEKSNIKDSEVSPQDKELDKLIRFLVENLGKDWKFFMRSLGLKEAILEMCIDSHPNRVREQIFSAFSEWKDDRANKDSLIRALIDIQRNDLVHDIQTGNY